jgi:VCBS repeat-containing protein
MKRFLFLIGAALLFLVLAGCNILWVPPGEVGIVVNQLGSQKGVQQDALGTGRYNIGMYHTGYLYPIFVKQYPFTKAPTEGNTADESFYFQTKDGNQENVDVAIQCQTDQAGAVKLFVKYRVPMEQIMYVNVRSYLRDLFNKYASTLTVDELYGPAKMVMLNNIQKELTDIMAPDGLEVKAVSYLGNIRFPQTIEDAINAKNVAVQEALTRENQVATAKAQADIAIANARGEAESNKIKQQSITEATIKWQELQIEMKALDKWNGALPQYWTKESGPLPILGNIFKQ